MRQAAIVLGLLIVLPRAGAAQRDATRIQPRPIQPPAAFAQAVAAGTRSDDGRPGPGYWQQRADYSIRASLDVSAGRLTGSETITYSNHSPDTLRQILLHIDQNVFKEGARRNRRVPITGGVTIERLEVDGRSVEGQHPGRRYYETLTLLVVPLPEPLPPGGRTEVGVSWSFTVPPAPTFRNGNLDDDVFAVAQWYPRVAVYDDVYGWDETPYLGDGEFYLEYGDFDVFLTVPSGWLIGATGTLMNPAEVLSEDAAERLARAATSNEVVRVVEADGRGPGSATRGAEGETLTWHFNARDVRDFAWSTSADYVWDAVRAEGGALAQALYRPEFRAWRETARYAAHTIRSMSDYLGEYIYPQVTITEGPVGGMEYPMLVLNPGTNNERAIAGVTIHEAAHQWFPMIVGSMEAKHAWMDEGFISYWDELSSRELWGEEPPTWGDNRGYLGVAGSEREVPLMRHTDLVSPHGQRTLAAYTKPAVVLGALRETVGDSVFLAAFRDYYETWKLAHPQPWDFFNTVERHAGQDLDWFWRPLFFETDVLDHAIGRVTVTDRTTTIELHDLGDVVLPARVTITMAGGSTVDARIEATDWLRGRTATLTVEGEATSVELDARHALPDVNRANDRWSR